MFFIWLDEYFLTVISGSLEITVDFLNEIDKLIQLIESPIFACEYDLSDEYKNFKGAIWHRLE